MDFQEELVKSIRDFPFIQGIIFADPDGEAILYEAPMFDPFDLKLAGAKIPIFMEHFMAVGLENRPIFMEIAFKNTYFQTLTLKQAYSITVIGNESVEKERLKKHLDRLAEKFNQEIF